MVQRQHKMNHDVESLDINYKCKKPIHCVDDIFICICTTSTLHFKCREYFVLCHLYFSLSDQRDSPVVTTEFTLAWTER